MKKAMRRLFAAYFSAFLFLCGMTPAHADLSLEETRQLLQKSLTVVQINDEIARLSRQESILADEAKKTEAEMGIRQEQADRTRERLGQVLRAYYTGERESLWLLLFNAESFSDLLAMYEYLQMIYANDRNVLKNYQTAYKELKAVHQRLEASLSELRAVKEEFIAQRERMLAIQKEVEAELQKHPEAIPVLKSQMEELQLAWKEKGLPVFQRYFNAIADAMQDLPELVMNSEGKTYLEGTVFKISDADLTLFLRSKSDILQNMTLRFADGAFTAFGQESGMEATIVGHYTVEQEPNRLQFHVDSLTYDGFLLDVTTSRALEQDYDLSFSPQAFSRFLQAAEVQTEEGTLTVKFKLDY